MANLTTRNNNKLQLTGNLITGDTYPVKDWLKTYCKAKWDKNARGWIVDTDELNKHITRGNSIALRVDDSVPTTPTRKTSGTSGWCNRCQDWCYGDCQAN